MSVIFLEYIATQPFKYKPLILLLFFSQQSHTNMILMKELIRLTTLISLIICTNCVGEPPLEIIKQWNLVNYNFQPNHPAGDKKFYDPEKIVTTGIEVSGDRIFLATPRLFSGVPATLSSVSRDSTGDSPVLKVRN